jgi:predicted transcriptional regulator
MSTEITVSLPDDVYQRVEHLSHRTGRSIPDLLAQTIELSVKPLGTTAHSEEPLSSWSDEEVLAATGAMMSLTQDERLSELLDLQQAGALTSSQRSELTALMEIYQEGTLHKAQALKEAVRRWSATQNVVQVV